MWRCAPHLPTTTRAQRKRAFSFHLHLQSTVTSIMASSSSSTSGALSLGSIPPAGSDLETTWKFLEAGIDHIMCRLQAGMSYSTYMSLYTTSYNYCTQSRIQGHVGLGGGEGVGKCTCFALIQLTQTRCSRACRSY